MRCYLCGGRVKEPVFLPDCKIEHESVLPSNLRHTHCFHKLEPASRKPEIQHSLLACTEPSWMAEDEVAAHMLLAFRDTFVRLFAPHPGTISELPVELQHMIADSCYESDFANSLRLTLVKDRTQSKRSVLSSAPIDLLGDIFIDYADIDGIRYITSLTNVRSGSDSQVLRLKSTRWTHIAISLDVFGCRTVSLDPPSRGGGDLWYRIIARSDVAQHMYVCFYEGRSVRDVVSLQDVGPPLFDTPEPCLPSAWYREKGQEGFETPRMMRRSTMNASGITVAFDLGTALDVHFHDDNDREAFQGFLRRMDRLQRPMLLRHAPLASDEIVVNVGVRVWPSLSSMGPSTACLLVSHCALQRLYTVH
jgi:hypothetical protein